jgi:LacI family transcriptional regulator
LIETSNAYARGLLEGVMIYVRRHDPWSLYLPELRRGEVPSGWLGRWKGDGIVARIENSATARAVARTKLPIVDVSAARRLPGAPWVETDDDAIARMALDHLRERGFKQFAYCGDPRFNWSRWREEHFLRRVTAIGSSCEVFRRSTTRSLQASADDPRHLLAWVQRLPKPIGILACYDIQAQRLLDACRDADVAVPEEAAVLGVDDDQLLCDLCTPPLSSIVPDTQRAGYAAAELLDGLMRGERPAASELLVPPRGVTVRQSTDVLAIDDRDVATAVRFIREHACDGVNAEDVLRQVKLSRRIFEARFRKLLGRTPHEEILRIKIDRVKRLLAETDLTLEAVAARTGFRHVEYLSVAFKRLVGVPPSRYLATNGN